MRIAIDIDGVLRDFVGSVHKQLIKHQLVVPETPQPKITAWDMHQFYPEIPKEKIYQFIFNSGYTWSIFADAEPYPGAKQFVEDLEAAGHVVGLVTSQNKNGWRGTVSWMHYTGVSASNIHCIRFDRGEKSKSNLGYEVLLDDKPENVQDFIDNGGKAFLFDQPWNQESALPRVHSYQEFIEKIKGMDV